MGSKQAFPGVGSEKSRFQTSHVFHVGLKGFFWVYRGKFFPNSPQGWLLVGFLVVMMCLKISRACIKMSVFNLTLRGVETSCAVFVISFGSAVQFKFSTLKWDSFFFFSDAYLNIF